MERSLYKTRLRNKGQITVPAEIRQALGVEEGDDLLFYADESGKIIVSRAQVIPPDQAWFWTERWQRMERDAEQDIQAGRVSTFNSIHEALTALDEIKADEDAND